METLQTDIKQLAWHQTPESIEIVRSADVFLYDSEGKEYIDFIMGWCVGNFGWENEEIKNSLQNFSGPTYVYPTFIYKPWLELANLLAVITPGKLEKTFRTTGGTDAIETALKIAMVYTGRKEFLSVDKCYHGNSIGALSIGDSANRDIYPHLLNNCHKIQRPLDEKALEQAETLLKTRNIAGLIIEPVITHPGIQLFPKGFLNTLRDLCDKYGTLLIADEVANGFGRTGKLFACEHYNLEPDILCLAKAISGGHAAMGAAITTDKIGSKVEEKIHAFPTYGWHPLSTEAGLASTRYFVKNQESILQNVNALSSLFRDRFTKMNFKHEITINMIGLAIAVDVKEASYAEKIANSCLKQGLLIEQNESNLMMFPALTMKEEIANKGLNILEMCI